MNGIQVRYYDKYDLTGCFTMHHGRMVYRYLGLDSLRGAKFSRIDECLLSTLFSSRMIMHNFLWGVPMVFHWAISQYYDEDSWMIRHRYAEVSN